MPEVGATKCFGISSASHSCRHDRPPCDTVPSTAAAILAALPNPRLFVSCGEPSGDFYGAELVRYLRSTGRELDVFGLGGDRLLEQGASLVAHNRDLAVVGITEVLLHLRRIHRIYRRTVEQIRARRPDVAVLVDYPDINLRLARELKKRGTTVVYYVSPQIWAWKKHRIHAVRETVDRMLVIFPFEEELYRRAGVNVTFVGHPLVDAVRAAPDRATFLRELGLDPTRPVVALLPGSRKAEVAHNLDPLLGAVSLLAARRPDLQFLLARAPGLMDALFARVPESVGVVRGQSHAVVGSAAVALVASGTATVETALLGTPMVVVYRLSSLTYVLGRRFVSVPHFAMPNLIAGRRIVPELIQADFTPERVASEALTLLENAGAAATMKQGLHEVRQKLGAPGASERAAGIVAKALERSRQNA